MAEFIDLAEKKSEMEVGPSKGPYYPGFSIRNVDVPIGPADVGKTITATVKLKVNSVEKRKTKEGSSYNCSFDVMSIAFNKGKVTTEKMKSMSSSDLDDLESQEYERLKSLGKGGKK